MTKKQFIEEIQDLPDDTPICLASQHGDTYFELTSIEVFDNEKYWDDQDEAKEGKIIVI